MTQKRYARIAAYLPQAYRQLQQNGSAKRLAEGLRKTGFDPSGTPDMDALLRLTGDKPSADLLAKSFALRSPAQAAPQIIASLGAQNKLTAPIIGGVAAVLARSGFSTREIAEVFDRLTEGRVNVVLGKLPAGAAPQVTSEGESTTVMLPPPPAEEGGEGGSNEGGGEGSGGEGTGGGNGTGGNGTGGEGSGGEGTGTEGGTPDGNGTGGEPNDPTPSPEPTEPKGFWGILNAILTGAAKGAGVGGALGAWAGSPAGPAGAAGGAVEGAFYGSIGGGIIGGGAYIFGSVMTLPDGSGDLVWY
ncbi:hypothetical protein [Litorivita sp. NS0012-18]|uniref:hypothetical protein n=1 Tax=Litorivita sp. NS0012-18 TaxID=3127655 RepID=UPI0031038F73